MYGRWCEFPGSSGGKASACDAGSYNDQVQSLGWEDPLEKGMATHSSILGLENAMDRGAWRATVHGLQRVGHD